MLGERLDERKDLVADGMFGRRQRSGIRNADTLTQLDVAFEDLRTNTKCSQGNDVLSR